MSLDEVKQVVPSARQEGTYVVADSIHLAYQSLGHSLRVRFSFEKPDSLTAVILSKSFPDRVTGAKSAKFLAQTLEMALIQKYGTPLYRSLEGSVELGVLDWDIVWYRPEGSQVRLSLSRIDAGSRSADVAVTYETTIGANSAKL